MTPAVLAAVETVIRHCQPQRILLFGSFARGTATAASDIDLLVIDAGFDGVPPRLRARGARQALYTCARRVDLLCHTPEEVEDAARTGHGFLATVLKRGVEVHRRE